MFRFFLIIFTYFFIIGFSYSLKITEVYFDWSDEYIWIYSKNYFSWNIILSWAKKSNIKLKLNINKNKEIIIWDDGIQNYFSWFINFKTWLGLSILDTKAMNIDLIYSWWKDNFFVSEDKVKKFNNTKTAFEKVFSWNKEIIQAVKKSMNMKKPYIWNPWYVSWIFDSNESNNSWQKYLDNGKNFKDSTLFTWEFLTCFIKLNSKDKDIYNLSFTWNKNFTWIHWIIDNKFYKTWLSLSTLWWNVKAVWNYKNYVCTWSFYIDKLTQNITQTNNKNNWELIVNEIHAWNNNFWEYVELKSIWDVSWNILFKWFSYWNSKISIPIKSFSWELIVLSKSYSWFVYTWNVLKVPKLSLTDNWWKLIIEKDGQALDNAIYKNKDSRYYSYSSGGIRYFKKAWPSSPWFKTFVTKYYKTQASYNCNILYQSFNDWKLNLTSKVLDKNICDKPYKQIWTYSWWIITWTCNPYSINIKKWNQNIKFQIFSWKQLLCNDTYKFFYNEKIMENKKVIQEKTKINFWTHLNCSIKIQWKDNYFFAWEPLNFISVVNNKEIQNSNTNYTCTYFLDNKLLSNKCNPYSTNISAWLHNLKLSITSNTWLTCQTVVYLNVPELSKDYILNHFTISDFKDLITKLKYKYSDSSLKTIVESLSYLYNQENYISTLNSTELNQLVENIKNKYKTNNTLKKIFDPIKFLYKDFKIGWNNNFIWNLNIVKVIPNYSWSKDIVILSWNLLTWLFIWTSHKKYFLSNYNLTWKNYLFIWNLWLTNKPKCINLYYKENVLDSICYINAKKWQYIKNLIRTKDKVIFKDDYIIINNQLIENIPFIKLKEKIKDAINIIKKKFKELIYKNKKIKKNKEKIYEQLIKRLVQDNEYKNKYYTVKKQLKEKNKKKYYQLLEKDKEIRQLKNLKSFLKSFIVHIKKNIPKDIYRQYLDKYKQAILWKKIKF